MPTTTIYGIRCIRGSDTCMRHMQPSRFINGMTYDNLPKLISDHSGKGVMNISLSHILLTTETIRNYDKVVGYTLDKESGDMMPPKNLV